MTVAAVSYERLVAVRLQSRYNDVFSSKRVLKYMATIWIVNIILTILQWAGINRASRGMHLIGSQIHLRYLQAKNVHNFKNVLENPKDFKHDLESAPWWVCSTFEDLDDITWAWNCMYNVIANNHIPLRKAKVRKHSLPWMSSVRSGKR